MGILDLIEAKIVEALNNHNDKSIIIITHYPVGQFGQSKSSAGLTFKDIIIKYQISAVLTGHSHPKTIQPQHHLDSLEVICSDLVSHRNIGIVSNDNGNIFYHSYSVEQRPSFIVTYPIDYKQISKMTMFNSKEVDVRVIAFTDSENETILCNGQGMNFDRHLRSGMSLYHIKMTFKSGFNNIHIANANNTEKEMIRFFIGSVSPSFKEKLGDERNYYKYSLSILILLGLIMFVVLFPFNIEVKFEPLMKLYNNCIEYLENRENEYKVIDHIKYILCGFLFVRFYLIKYNKNVMLYLFMLFLSPLILPLGLIKSEEHFGLICIYGTFLNNHLYPTQFVYLIYLIHIGIITIPLTFITAMFGKERKFSLCFVVDIIFALFCLIITIYYSLFSISHATTLVLSATNFLFVLLPFAYMIYLLLF
ncbi:hypothetical protein TVAG_479360 [Trichomonas vaginalis G3]|uniref:Ser/Thr protein phosphatase n=1 Tax=Trichomonas vaginalis (strain ATCC PRA-98 / G3) TaxID=412133 RepID=A2G7X7_TRIV3|nr:helicase related family [Trichomonas vaginalis G3]EAX86745.1 hypothetical protein TVAG_479360 [Trichomonas vaginalis G3]KAI5509170.1 helicase related family [Trichomonas vaginalis G3]|eukprot:XP_001299675.1 hypothetical protein [Trichomonas vaginalis G3]